MHPPECLPACKIWRGVENFHFPSCWFLQRLVPNHSVYKEFPRHFHSHVNWPEFSSPFPCKALRLLIQIKRYIIDNRDVIDIGFNVGHKNKTLQLKSGFRVPVANFILNRSWSWWRHDLYSPLTWKFLLV